MQLQGPWFDPELCLRSVWSLCACSSHGLCGFYMRSPVSPCSRRISYAKLPLALSVFTHDALCWTDVLFSVYSHLAISVPGIGTFLKIKLFTICKCVADLI